MAKDVADWIRRGLTIEQLDTEQVRVQLQHCCHDAKQLTLEPRP